MLKQIGLLCTLTAVLAVAANAKDLDIVAPIIPPHFDEQGRGRMGDVIETTLVRCGHGVRFTMVPFGRHWKEYRDTANFDGLATAEADQTFPGFSTLPFMHLQDGATVVATVGLQEIKTVAGLHAKRVVAFPDARKILKIERDVATFASYVERSNRFDQLRPLLAGRVDAVLADGLITAHFIGVLRSSAEARRESENGPSQQVIFRKIFEEGKQRLYFRDERIARDFDRCFAELLANGDVERLVRPYMDKYRSIVGDQYPRY